ncbi:MAG: L,D-transpeptidase [Pseudomonadota bacterium]|nr:L,D-transpeptidase [Pseudomonadota bacterium]
MRSVLAYSAICLACGPWLDAARAEQPQVVAGIYNSAPAEAPRDGGDALGGGFIQLLFTGHTRSTPAPRHAEPAPNLAYAPRREDSIVGGYSAARPDYASLAPEARPAQEPPPQFHRQEVDYPTRERPGTVVIDTPNKFLYLVEPDGRALRYGVGVGRPGFEWAGVKTVSRKAEWPGWTPPPEMMKRRPDLPAHMDGGPDNPLGARALYLGSSMYRIHGTNEPWTIGQNVSSGCIRMMNDDVIDLYERVKVGSKVIVM